MSDNLKLGQIITDPNTARDAIHIAVVPLMADVLLLPGNRIGLSSGTTDRATTGAQHVVGIVDPFLSDPVKPGQRFWCYLFPGTITNLRHHWEHPSFPDIAPTGTDLPPVQQLPPTQYPPAPAIRWRPREIVRMCMSMLKDGDFTDLPFLSDRMEELGCDDAKLLKDCRDTSEGSLHKIRLREVCCRVIGGEYEKSAQWLRDYAVRMNSYDDFPDTAFERLITGLKKHEILARGSNLHDFQELGDFGDPEELKEHAERFLGIAINWDDYIFTCSC